MIGFAGIAYRLGPCRSPRARLAMPAWPPIGGRDRGPCAAAFRPRQIKHSAARNNAAPSASTKTPTAHRKSASRTVQVMNGSGKPTGLTGTAPNACAAERLALADCIWARPRKIAHQPQSARAVARTKPSAETLTFPLFFNTLAIDLPENADVC